MNDKLLPILKVVAENISMLQFEFVFMEIIQQLKIQLQNQVGYLLQQALDTAWREDIFL